MTPARKKAPAKKKKGARPVPKKKGANRKRTPAKTTKPAAVKKTGRKAEPKPSEITVAMGALVPQPHGGAIKRGNPKGTPPGPGRPPSALRQRARELFDRGLDHVVGPAIDGRVRILLGFADDEELAGLLYTEYQAAAAGTEVCHFTPWDQVLPGERRPWVVAAGKARQSHKDLKELVQEAGINERLRAMELTGKFGLGEKHTLEVVSPDVVQRLERQADAIVETLPADLAAALARRFEEIWS